MDINNIQEEARLKLIADNATCLANIIELTTSVLIKTAGTDMADSVSNNSVSRVTVTNMVANRIKEKVLKGAN